MLVGTALAGVSPQQQPLQVQSEDSPWAKPLEVLKDSLKNLGDDAKHAWNDLAAAFPDAVNDYTFFSAPKKHARRPDSEWDHIVRGGDVQSVWVEGADGQKHREIDGKLQKYDLRVKVVDTSTLGVDPGVKQFSGYLDDNENDKHLFYCKLSLH